MKFLLTKNVQRYFAIIVLISLSKSLIHSIMNNNNNGILFTDYSINESFLQIFSASLNQTKRVQVDLTNCSYLNVFKNVLTLQTVIPVSSSDASVVNLVNSNNNYSLNSIELISNYFSAIKLSELFCTANLSSITNSRVVSTHTSFDCDDNTLNTNTSSTSNIPIKKIICLSASINQIVSVIKSFLTEYNYKYYSIVYSNVNEDNFQLLDYYKNLAKSLVYKLSINSFKLDFKISISNPFLFDKLVNAQATSM